MHSQCWSGCNGHDLILGTIEMQTISGVDMIFKSIYVNECFTTMSTNFTAVDRVTKRNEEIFNHAWYIVIFPHVSFPWDHLKVGSVAF